MMVVKEASFNPTTSIFAQSLSKVLLLFLTNSYHICRSPVTSRKYVIFAFTLLAVPQDCRAGKHLTCAFASLARSLARFMPAGATILRRLVAVYLLNRGGFFPFLCRIMFPVSFTSE